MQVLIKCLRWQQRMHEQIGEGKSFYFVMNFKDEELEIPEEFAGKKDLLSGNEVEKGEKLPKFGVKIVEE